MLMWNCSAVAYQNIDLWPPFRGAITPLHITLVLIRCQELFIG